MQNLPQFLIEEFFKTRVPQKIAEGPMDFNREAVDAGMQGETAKEIRQSAKGQMSLRGKNLMINELIA